MRVQRRMFAAQKACKWSSLTEERLTKLRALDFDFEPRAHYNYKKQGKTGKSQTENDNEEQEGDDDDDSDDEQGEDLKESPPRIPVRVVPEYQQCQPQPRDH
jgi:hypothetical protein